MPDTITPPTQSVRFSADQKESLLSAASQFSDRTGSADTPESAGPSNPEAVAPLNQAQSPEPKPALAVKPSKQNEISKEQSAPIKDPKPETPGQGKEPPASEGVKQLRGALDRAHTKLKELEESGTATSKQLSEASAKVADYATKLAQREEEIEKTYKPIAAKLTEYEKRLQEREEQLRIRDYTATTEFYDKYEKPLATARADAEALLNETEVIGTDGQPRRATPQDFNFVLEAQTINEAARRAKALFGEDVYQSIVNQATRIRQLARQRAEGQKNAALESAEFIKKNQATQAQVKESLRQKMLAECEAQLSPYKPTEGDEEMTRAYHDGAAFADRAVYGDPSHTLDQVGSTLGKARAEIIAAHVMRQQISRKDAQIAQLQEKLSAYERSEPEVKPRNGGPVPKPSNDREEVKKNLLAEAMKFAGT